MAVRQWVRVSCLGGHNCQASVKTSLGNGLLGFSSLYCCSFRWPGNVRELRNVLEQMMVLAEGEVLTERDLPDTIAESGASAAASGEIPTGLTMDELEKLAITKALDQCAGNRTHAANRLGISVRTLQRKLQQYKLEKPSKPFPNDVLTEA